MQRGQIDRAQGAGGKREKKNKRRKRRKMEWNNRNNGERLIFLQVSPAAQPLSIRTNSNSSPHPELATMTNVNVLDLHMNAHAPITRESEEIDRKESRTESYDEWYESYSMSQPQFIVFYSNRINSSALLFFWWFEIV